MKLLYIILILIAVQLSYGQQVYRKQITFMPDADCKNFATIDGYGASTHFAFEADYGNKTNIILGTHNPLTDSFSVLINVTDNEFRNINPSIFYGTYDTLIVVYQTNENGNWDIAYRYVTSTWVSPEHFIANTSYDETDLKLAEFSYSFQNYFAYLVHYPEGTGINVQKDLSSEPVEVFHPLSNSSYKYPALAEAYYPNKMILIASADSSDSRSYIVSTILDQNNIWGNKTALLQVKANNTSFNAISYNSNISFDAVDTITNKRSIYGFNLGSPEILEKLVDDSTYNFSDLKTAHTHIVGDFQPRSPYIFKAERNDSVFIAVPKDTIPLFSNTDTLIYTKVNSAVCIGKLASYGEAFYSVWQDSANGHIQLFARKTYDPSGGVQDEVSPMDYILYQNYPNPFNPSTTISYNLLKGSNIKISVYSLLGEIIAVPLNEYQLAGNHTIKFNAANLPSGIYFYELSVEGSRSVKKMLLLK